MSRTEILVILGLVAPLAILAFVRWLWIWIRTGKTKDRTSETVKKRRRWWAIVLGALLALGFLLADSPRTAHPPAVSRSYSLGYVAGEFIWLAMPVWLILWGFRGKEIKTATPTAP